MTTREQWLALAERCEKATGPDDSINVWIENYCGIARFEPPHPFRADADGDKRVNVRPLAASLDAITALIERELPAAWAWTLGQNIHHRTWGVSINNFNEDGAVYSVCWGSSATSPALALCAAFCRAMATLSPAIDTTPGTL